MRRLTRQWLLAIALASTLLAVAPAGCARRGDPSPTRIVIYDHGQATVVEPQSSRFRSIGEQAAQLVSQARDAVAALAFPWEDAARCMQEEVAVEVVFAEPGVQAGVHGAYTSALIPLDRIQPRSHVFVYLGRERYTLLVPTRGVEAQAALCELAGVPTPAAAPAASTTPQSGTPVATVLEPPATATPALEPVATSIPTLPPATSAPSPSHVAQVPEPTVIAARVRDELRTIPTSSPSGRPGWRITGWAGGLRSHRYGDGAYRWLDDGHLLLFLLCSRAPDGFETSQPTLLNLADGQAWTVPPGTDEGAWDAVQWSAALGRLVVVDNGELQLVDLQGNVTRRITGPAAPPLFLSPGGLRAFSASAWFDLESGRRVAFVPLDIKPVLRLHWSADETRVFTCCYTYADARSGAAYQASAVGGLFAPGKGVGPGDRVQTGRWLAGDRYFLPSRAIDSTTQGGSVAAVLAFDPAEKAWVDVLGRAGLPAWPGQRFTPEYSPPVVLSSPDGRLLAVGHYVYARAGDRPVYLVDATSFAGRAIAGSEGMRLISWSGDGRYLLLFQPGQGYRFASVERAALEPGLIPMAQAATSPNQPGATDRRPLWQPDGARLAYVEGEGRRVCIWDAVARRLEGGVDLPVPAAQLVWSERGGELAVLADDGSLWWLADPAAGRAEQLTPPMPGAGSVRWSPDATQLAVASATEVYVIEVGS